MLTAGGPETCFHLSTCLIVPISSKHWGSVLSVALNIPYYTDYTLQKLNQNIWQTWAIIRKSYSFEKFHGSEPI